jgi:Peptidase_C39 like family
MKKAVWVALCLFGLLAAPPLLRAVQLPASADQTVTANMAAAIAATAVDQTVSPTLAQIRAGSPGRPVLDPGLLGSDGAYVVPFVGFTGSQVGYVVVSATMNRAPILRISSGSWPALLAARKAEAQQATGQAIVQWTTAHLDSFTEVATFTTASGVTDEMLLDSGQIGTITGQPSAVPSASKAPLGQWASLMSTASHPFEGLANALSPAAYADSATQNELTPFPNYTWYQGCTPTAGFMTLAYLSQHGFPRLMATADYVQSMSGGSSQSGQATPGTGPYISELANDLGTSGGWTYDSSIATGMGNFQQTRNYQSAVGDFTNAGYGTLVTYINRGEPMVGSFSGWLYYSPTGTMYNGYEASGQRIDHSVAIFGFENSSYTNASYMIVRDDAPEDGANLVQWDNNWSYDQLDVPQPGGPN